MATTYEDILTTLPTLTKDQKEGIKLRLELLDEISPPQDTDNSELALLYSAVLKSSLVNKNVPLGVLMKRPLGKKYKLAHERVEKFIARYFGEVKHNERLKLYAILCSCTEKELQRRKVPANLRTFIGFLCYPKSVFTSQFPQYLYTPAALQLLIKATGNG